MKDFEKVATVVPQPKRPQDEIRFRDFHIRAIEVPETVEVEDEEGNVAEQETGVMLTEIQCVELTLIACKKGDDSVTEIAVLLCLKGDNAKAFLAPFESELKKAISSWMVSLDTDE